MSTPGDFGDLLEGLNDRQGRAVGQLDGPVMVVAGPGSGKTTVLTRRIAALLRSGVPAGQVLAVTFTNKASGEMKERLAALVGAGQSAAVWMGTFHSVCLRLLRPHADMVGLRPGFSVVDDSESKKIIAMSADALGHFDGKTTADRKAYVKDLQSDISSVKNAGGHFDSEGMRVAVGEVMRDYDRRLGVMNAVDFDDILLKTLRLLQRHSQVAAEYQGRFSYILVDEFQDTNVVQSDLVDLLAAKHHNLFVVGDFDQSIYAFRGADPGVMRRFDGTWPGAEVIGLNVNYRSTGSIVRLSRSVVSPNPAVHRPEMRTDNREGDPPSFRTFRNGAVEAAAIAKIIADRSGPFSGHAILVRTRALMLPFEKALAKEGLPYTTAGGLRFYERAEVKTVLAYVRLAVNPSDRMAFDRCVNEPARGLGSTTVARAVTAAEHRVVAPEDELVSACRTAAQRAAAEEFLHIMGLLRGLLADGPGPVVRFVAEDAGLAEWLERGAGRDGPDRAGNVRELVAQASEFATSGSGVAAVEEFLRMAALFSSSEDADSSGAVLVSTVHAAKGKEFDHVYVPAVEKDVFPHVMAGSDVAEERRLFFVAVSRARATLMVSWAKERTVYGRETVNEPSLFLKGLVPGVGGNAVAPGRSAKAVERRRGWNVGDRVSHPKFGVGVVRAADRRTVVADFREGSRTLSLRHAPLSPA